MGLHWVYVGGWLEQGHVQFKYENMTSRLGLAFCLSSLSTSCIAVSMDLVACSIYLFLLQGVQKKKWGTKCYIFWLRTLEGCLPPSPWTCQKRQLWINLHSTWIVQAVLCALPHNKYPAFPLVNYVFFHAIWILHSFAFIKTQPAPGWLFKQALTW